MEGACKVLAVKRKMFQKMQEKIYKLSEKTNAIGGIIWYNVPIGNKRCQNG